MTHMMFVEMPVLKIKKKDLDAPRHELIYTAEFRINSRKESLWMYLDEVPLSVVSTETLEQMRNEIHRLCDELDEKENYIVSLKEAAKTLIEAASWRDSE